MNNHNVFSRKQVPLEIITELGARSTRVGLVWSAKRFPWIHITSLSSICHSHKSRLRTLSSLPNESKGPAANNILFTTYEKAGIAIRPVPVVTGIQVKKQGELGTTRKATISVTAFSDEQLLELQKCFFVPGLGCRVEWGWSEDCRFNKSTGPLQAALTMPDAEVIAEMKKRTYQESHYEGLQGMVANFSYNLTQDNIWECSIEVIAAAESFSRSSVAVQGNKCTKCAREQTKKDSKDTKVTVVETKSLLYTFFKDMVEDLEAAANSVKPYLDKILKLPNWNGSDDPNVVSFREYEWEGIVRDETGTDSSGFFSADTWGDPQEGFVSWPTLEALINLRAIPYNKNTNEYTIGRVASPMHTPITYHPSVFSTNPRVCLILGPQASLTERTITRLEKSVEDVERPTPPESASPLTLQHIYVNIIHILTVLDRLEKGSPEDRSIQNFIMTLLNDVNEACGSLWQFEIINRTDVNKLGGPCISVIDTKISDKKNAIPIVEFAIPASPENSVVRSIKLEMKMTDSMKSQALYSNGSQQSTKTVGGGGCGANVFTPFGLNKAKSLNMSNRADEDPDCSICEKTSTASKEELTLDEWIDEMSSHIDETVSSGAKNALIKEYSKNIKETNNDYHCHGMILPFEFGFTLDGIGGFGFGQMVSCDRIPKQVRDGYEWQVTTVEHTITPNDWSTTVSTVCRYKSKAAQQTATNNADATLQDVSNYINQLPDTPKTQTTQTDNTNIAPNTNTIPWDL